MIIIVETLNKIIRSRFTTLGRRNKFISNEESLWKVSGEIKNPAGNLCLHLCGNLQHYIGAILGHTSYVQKQR